MSAASVPASVIEEVAKFGVDLGGPLGVRLASYLELLLAANQAFNLTAITSVGEAWVKHVGDSLSLFGDLSALPAGARVVDLGSGGGLPAIPLALALPSLSFTLVESTGKKARFLEQTAATLGLANLRVVSERAETFGQGPERERFDAATSRALSRLPVLLELSLPLVRVGGVKLAIKGEQAEQEVQEAQRALGVLGGRFESARRTSTGTVVCIRKHAHTPARYPRLPGEPKRRPIV
ncbi:MAG: 16S rRNA (guanine(527)-N(7))-methyltransferase RsmG [Myxococcales bacterium]